MTARSDGPITFTGARMVLPDRLQQGWLTIDGDRIVALGPGTPPGPGGTHIDLGGRYLAPGLVDIHCHGADGAVVYSGSDDDLARVTTSHLRRGTTSMLASVATTPVDRMIDAASTIGSATRAGRLPNLAGVHLEGPFLSPVRRGAQLESALAAPDPSLTGRLLNAAGEIPIMMTIAPELEGAVMIIEQYASRCRFAIGHTDATFEQTMAAVGAGVRHVTHLFNGMIPLGHRSPGPITAALTDPRLSYELIADGHHIATPVLRLAAAVEGGRRAVLVTDASIAAGLGDGHYAFSGREVDVIDGVVRRSGTGSLSGSTVFLIDCVRTMITRVGVGVADGFRMASQTPAAAAGLADRGSLAVGNRADLLVLTEEFPCRKRIAVAYASRRAATPEVEPAARMPEPQPPRSAMSDQSGVSRRNLFQLVGLSSLGAVGVGALGSACAPATPKSAPGSHGAAAAGGEFHAGTLYLPPTQGNYNCAGQPFVKVPNAILFSGNYGDLVMLPSAFYHWKQQTWDLYLIDSYKLDDATKTYTVTIKSDLTWSDGKPITSQDYLTTFWCQWVLGSPLWEYIDKIAAPDDHTFTMSMNQPAPVVERYLLHSNIIPTSQYGDIAEQARKSAETGERRRSHRPP
ncbi:hypothetical protein GCM10027613_39610 [Microlunatus endophyticus]